MMWFKQIQLFQINDLIDIAELSISLEKLKFRSCLPNLPISIGWISPIEDFADFLIFPSSTEFAETACKNVGLDEEDEEEDDDDKDERIIQANLPLVYEANGYLMICLQIEKKILPATIVRDQLKKQIRKIQANEKRRVSVKEKQALREDVYHRLIPKAFGKLSKIYAFIDVKNNWLILNTTAEKKTEIFISFLKKTFHHIELKRPKTNKISNIMTNWLQSSKYSKTLTIENCCVLQDPKKQGRIIRCQQQDLFAPSINALLKDGYEISQMQLTWNDELTFTLKNDFTLGSLKYQNAVMEFANEAATETRLERFGVDFLIMTEIISKLMIDLMQAICKN